jgi:hypothetical protein
VLAIGICVASRGAFAGENGDNGTAEPLVTTAKPTNGSVKCTANINSDGSVLACKHCNAADTVHLGLGTYQVGFSKPCQNILAVDGWSRWVQADALSNGAEVAFCTTADRFNDVNAIFVECQNASGPVDESFFLFVAK